MGSLRPPGVCRNTPVCRSEGRSCQALYPIVCSRLLKNLPLKAPLSPSALTIGEAVYSIPICLLSIGAGRKECGILSCYGGGTPDPGARGPHGRRGAMSHGRARGWRG